MKWWDKYASDLQAMGRNSEADKRDTYSDEQVTRAIVYTREDTVLVVSQLSSVNIKLEKIRTLLSFILVAIILAIVGGLAR